MNNKFPQIFNLCIDTKTSGEIIWWGGERERIPATITSGIQLILLSLAKQNFGLYITTSLAWLLFISQYVSLKRATALLLGVSPLPHSQHFKNKDIKIFQGKCKLANAGMWMYVTDMYIRQLNVNLRKWMKRKYERKHFVTRFCWTPFFFCLKIIAWRESKRWWLLMLTQQRRWNNWFKCLKFKTRACIWYLQFFLKKKNTVYNKSKVYSITLVSWHPTHMVPSSSPANIAFHFVTGAISLKSIGLLVCLTFRMCVNINTLWGSVCNHLFITIPTHVHFTFQRNILVALPRQQIVKKIWYVWVALLGKNLSDSTSIMLFEFTPRTSYHNCQPTYVSSIKPLKRKSPFCC